MKYISTHVASWLNSPWFRSTALLIALFSYLVFFSSNTYASNSLRIATASNFLPSLQLLALQFEQKHAIHVDIIAGSSGKLFTQISHGLPVDIFLSGDTEKPQLLHNKQLATSPITYAQGALVFWGSHATSTNTASNAVSTTLAQALQHCKNMSIANAKLAPYGKASMQSLAFIKEAIKIHPSSYQLITSENINQSLRFKISRHVDCTFIAKSQAIQLSLFKTQHHATLINIPEHWHTPIIQQAVILNRSKNKNNAQLFMHFLLSEKNQQFIRSQGYLAITPLNNINVKGH